MIESNQKIVVSGMRPTGPLHLGHYFGVLKNWIGLQKKYRCYFFVADWHCLTTEYSNVSEVKHYLHEMVLDWLSCGLDPTQVVLFVQSRVPEHAELYLLFSMITPLGWLTRVPSYKELQAELTSKDLSTYGFLGYPLLQTADVAIYKANFVPVGQDQVAHIELAREVIRRFNHLYREIFPEPQILLNQAARIVGTDGRKMSKSYQNSIYLSDSLEQTNEKIRHHYTDPARKRRTDPGNPDRCPIFAHHQQVTNLETTQQINEDCRKAAIGCVDCKKILMKNVEEELVPYRIRRERFLKKPETVTEILAEGSQKAQQAAKRTLAEANEAMGI